MRAVSNLPMRRAGLGLLPAALVLSLSAVGCTDDSDGPIITGDSGSSDGGTPSKDAGGSDASGHGELDAKLPPVPDGRLDGAAGDDGSMFVDAAEAGTAPDANLHDDAASGDAATALPNPTLVSARASQIGRLGADLRIDVTAIRGTSDTVAVSIELLDGTSSVLGSAQLLPFEVPIAVTQGSAFVRLDGVFTRYSGLTAVRITLVDDVGGLSEQMDISITSQPMIGVDGACDLTFMANRCISGLGCKGVVTQTCQPGEAPSVVRLGYFVDELGARILFEGTDIDADVVSYRMSLFDEAGQPIAIDHDDSDSTPKTDTITGPIGTQTDNTLFVELRPSQVLIDNVARIQVSLLDSTGLESEPAMSDKAAAPARELGQSCDARDFNRCTGGTCNEAGSQHVCALATDAQQAACNAALVLNPSAGITSVRGTFHTSLWEPPAGCSPGLPHQPDRVVKLVLANTAARLVLSTDHPYTSFDTELYLLTDCTAAPKLSWCSADQPPPVSNPLAILTLNGVAAGEYFVVVDSYPYPSDHASGDTFELTVTVQ
ncbi:MAG: hypothetical protein JWN04_2369 [Myxococcaceae bacterium]|nr:hypothetical protein [Myxococcaceae bacterium]